MKPKRQEDSSCVFAYFFVAALAIAAIPREKKEHRNQFGADQEKKFCKSRQDDTAGKSSVGVGRGSVKVSPSRETNKPGHG